MLPLVLLILKMAGAEELTLEGSIKIALKHNPDVLKAEQLVREKKWALMYYRSERLPQVSLVGNYYGAEDTAHRSAVLRVSQEVLRFGRTPYLELKARREYRKARFAYRRTVADVISQVRKAFLSVLLTEDEIAERMELLKEFERKHRRMEERLEAGKVRPIDVKEARLEVLDERLRINTLERALRAQKLELLKVMGLLGRASPDGIELVGEVPEEEVPEDSLDAMVRKALENRSEVAELREEVEEQRRLVRQALWEWFPGITASASYGRGRTDLNFRMSKVEGQWRGTMYLERPLGRGTEREDWEVRVGLVFPIFRGMRNWGVLQEERAKLKSLEYELKKLEDRIELEVREDFFKVLDAKERLDIQRERVEITKERLEIFEALIEYEWARYITYEDLLRRREDFHSTQREYFSDRREYVMALEDLRRAVEEF
ncbi:MAG TPA: TolC family protein [Firmicutes bacterium]|nr:TolC family protein [Bacillota bacterium]